MVVNDEEMFLLSTTGRILFVAQKLGGELKWNFEGEFEDLLVQQAENLLLEFKLKN